MVLGFSCLGNVSFHISGELFRRASRRNGPASLPAKQPRFRRTENEQSEWNYGQSRLQRGRGTGCDHGEQKRDSRHDLSAPHRLPMPHNSCGDPIGHQGPDAERQVPGIARTAQPDRTPAPGQFAPQIQQPLRPVQGEGARTCADCEIRSARRLRRWLRWASVKSQSWRSLARPTAAAGVTLQGRHRCHAS
jgi:hypothetical protein